MTVEDMQLIVVRTAAFIADLFTERRDFRNLGGPVEIAKARSLPHHEHFRFCNRRYLLKFQRCRFLPERRQLRRVL